MATDAPHQPVPYYDEDPRAAEQIGERLVREQTRADRRVLIRGGAVITMDAAIGDFAAGDVLIEGRRIVAVGPRLADDERARDAVEVSAAGMVVIPGMCDSHRHCWQTQFRRAIPDVADLAAYVAATHRTLAFAYQPQDVYVGNLLAALGGLDGGVTSIVDISHNSRSAAHRDEAVRGHLDSGARSVYGAHGALFGDWDELWPQDLVRLREEYFGDDDALVTLRLACHGSDAAAARDRDDGLPSVTLDPAKIAFARDLGIGISVDGVLGTEASANVESLGTAGLLGPDITLIHMTAMSDRAWELIADSRTAISLTPTSDAQIGILDALPPIQKALDMGIRPSLSVDTEATLSSDMFTQMRFILNVQRMGVFKRRHEGEQGLHAITTRDVLEFATLQGARANGLADKVGSLTPGKQADIVLIRAEDINNMPLNTALGTVVSGADTSNVDTVFVAGDARKWRGRLVGQDLNRIRSLAHESFDRILRESGFDLDPLV
ncbi:amidohydrolase family protein [Conexibacter sp. CPCC 206217]|uniref:amidohydrolase family protein n=1 Tax=Conexibacter sp. CPCC 206217 TaxID=3064574 RepID=UPI002718A40E|nr:amidohydrolase family protein [Conexibacter sp. CPCC 206217]MDO8210234.1 amidohydrolase family protein [Conexibacter sp. CPCC 206217]